MITFKLANHSKMLLAKLGSSATGKDIAAAHKKAGVSGQRKMRVEVNKQIRAEKPVKLSEIRKRTKSWMKGSNINDLEWGIRLDGSALPVGAHPMRQTKKGVKFKAKSSHWSLYQGSFTGTMKSGHRGAFRKAYPEKSPKARYRGPNGRNRKHLPIKEIYTSGISSAFKEKRPRDAVNKAGIDEYTRTFLRVIRSKL